LAGRQKSEDARLNKFIRAEKKNTPFFKNNFLLQTSNFWQKE
jgi:hypothetical protein